MMPKSLPPALENANHEAVPSTIFAAYLIFAFIRHYLRTYLQLPVPTRKAGFPPSVPPEG
jgi:hypothetical protein